MPDSATQAPKHPPLDEETAAALTLFNTYLVADREQQAHERALKKAEKAKDDAAAAVRKLNERKASASETAAAETKYRDAVEALQRLRDGGTAAPEGDDDTAAPEGEDDKSDEEAADTTTEDTTTEETPAETASEEAADTTTEDTTTEETPAETASEDADEDTSVGVEASVGDDDLTGDEPAGAAG